MNHTTGPWKIHRIQIIDRPVRVGAHFAIRPESGPTFAFLPAERSAAKEATQEANARLIAAAPELLRELKSAIFYIETYGGDVTTSFSAGGNLDAVKATIAKAEGKG